QDGKHAGLQWRCDGDCNGSPATASSSVRYRSLSMVLVAGSTGVLGMGICRRLRERGQPVRALVRASSAPDRVGALQALGCELVIGDLKDRDSLDRACAGADVIISTVSAIATAKEGDSFSATDGAGNINLIDAAVAP